MTLDSPTEARGATLSISELAGCSGLELVARLADGSIRRPPMAEFIDSVVMHVLGRVVSRGRTVITLEGRIEDAKGRLHAHGTSTCLVVSRKP